MISPRTLRVGSEPVDLAEGTRFSQVQVAVLRNHGPHDVWLGEVGNGFRLRKGESLPGGLGMGGSDHLSLVADVPKGARGDDASEVDAVLIYEQVWAPEDGAG